MVQFLDIETSPCLSLSVYNLYIAFNESIYIYTGFSKITMLHAATLAKSFIVYQRLSASMQ